MPAVVHPISSPPQSQQVVGTVTHSYPMAQQFPCGPGVIGPHASPQVCLAAQMHSRGHGVTQEVIKHCCCLFCPLRFSFKQLAAAFLQQEGQPARASRSLSGAEAVSDATATGASDPSKKPSTGKTIAPPPPPARPVHRRTSQVCSRRQPRL